MARYFFTTLLLLGCLASGTKAQEEKYIGLFIYNFTKFIDWPEGDKTGDFIIVIAGHKSVGDELKRITAGKKVGNQNIVIHQYESVKEISGDAHVIFIGHWQSRFIDELFPKISGKHVLLISEMEGMLDKGSGINFIIREGEIRFEMKVSNISKYSLKTDQRIRELAFRVVD